MSQGHVDSVRGVYDGWERGEFTAGESLLDEEVTLAIDPDIPDGGDYAGTDGVRNYMKAFLEPWESLAIAGESFEAVGDRVLVAVRQTGIGRGSGVAAEMHYFQVWTFQGGKVIRLETILSEKRAREATGLA